MLKAVIGLNSIKQGPVFIYSPPGHVSFLNSRGVVIDCLAHGYPDPDIQWMTSDGDVIAGRLDVRVVAENGSLVFYPFDNAEYKQDVHAAKYICSAVNKYGRIISTDVNVRAVVPQDYEAQVYDEYIEVENTAVLRCQVPSYVTDDVTVTAWIRDDDLVISRTDSVDGKYTIFSDGALHVNDVSKSDSQHSFRCQTKHDVLGEAKLSRSSGKIIVSDAASTVPPRLVHHMQQVVKMEGDNILIPCVFHGSPVPDYRWFVDDGSKKLKPITMNSRISQNGGSLLIKNALTTDSGKLVCRSSNSVGSETAITKLIVTAPLTVYITPQAQVIDDNKMAIFNCSVYGSPISNVKWTKNGEHLEFGRRSDIDLAKNRRSIIIPSVNHNHEGMYQCFAENDMEKAQGTAQLILGRSKPLLVRKFTEKLLQSGPSLTLTCEATGNPLPSFIWTLDGIPVGSIPRILQQDHVDVRETIISTIRIKSVISEDGGVYQCKAANEAGMGVHQAKVNVYGVPFVRNLRNVTIVSSATAYLHCYAGGYPITSIEWYKDGTNIIEDNKYRIFRNGTLFVRHASKPRDNGRYTCTVSNNQGQSASGTLFLRVLLKPDLEPMPDRSVEDGRSVRITCTLSDGDKPVKLVWLKGDQPVDLQLGITVSEHDYISVLTIQNIHSVHDGNYTCVATNMAGSVNRTTRVHVKVPPSWKTRPMDTRASVGSDVYIHCEVKGHPKPKIYWRRKIGQTMTKIVGKDQYVIMENGTLLIEKVKTDYNGKYTCKADNGIGSGISSSTNLQVGVVPRVAITSRNKSVAAGEDSTLLCEISGANEVTCEWNLDGQPLINRIPKEKFQEKIYRSGNKLMSELQLFDMQSSQSGYYECKGSNLFGDNSTAVFVFVRGVPSCPTNVHASKITEKTVKVSWKASRSNFQPIKYFVLQYRLSNDIYTGFRNMSVQGTRHSGILKIAGKEIVYQVRVIAVNDIGESEPCGVLTFEISKNGTLNLNHIAPSTSQSTNSSAMEPLYYYVKIILSISSSLIFILCIIALIVCKRKRLQQRRLQQCSTDKLKRSENREQCLKSPVFPESCHKGGIHYENKDRLSYGLISLQDNQSERSSRYVSTEPADYYSDVSPYATFSLADAERDHNKVELKTFTPRTEIATEL